MTTREQVEGYRRDLDALVVLLLAELAREWTAAGLPILPGIGRPRAAQAAARTARSTASAATVTAGAAAVGGVALLDPPDAPAPTVPAPPASAAVLTAAQVNAATDELLRTLPPLVADFQAAAASLGADFFDTARADLGIRGRYAATPLAARDDARQEILVRWATQPLRPANMPAGADLLLDDRSPGEDVALPDAGTSLLRLVGATERQVLAPARETVIAATEGDPADARWARVARLGSCAFCLVMAGRGPVYHSKQTAGFVAEGTPNRFHDDCSCSVVPSWPSAPYEVDDVALAGEAAYYAARDESGSGDLRQILSAMRKATGSR